MSLPHYTGGKTESGGLCEPWPARSLAPCVLPVKAGLREESTRTAGFPVLVWMPLPWVVRTGEMARSNQDALCVPWAVLSGGPGESVSCPAAQPLPWAAP